MHTSWVFVELTQVAFTQVVMCLRSDEYAIFFKSSYTPVQVNMSFYSLSEFWGVKSDSEKLTFERVIH